MSKEKKSTVRKKKKTPIMSIDDPRFRSLIMSALRQKSRYWKPSEACIAKTRIARGVHICPACGEAKRRKDMKKDHIDPIIPLTGFTTWDDVIKRMFASEDSYQALCEICHNLKTSDENAKRKALRKEKAVLQYNKNRRRKSSDSES
jgi:5-methylcytosine-specific restriction endonuclease McrA